MASALVPSLVTYFLATQAVGRGHVVESHTDPMWRDDVEGVLVDGRVVTTTLVERLNAIEADRVAEFIDEKLSALQGIA